jgi:Tn3 transposase DDE domain
MCFGELKNALRSGDIWVPGSRQFRDFEDYLLPTAAFESLDFSQELPLTAGGSFDRYWTERETRLRRELEKVDSLAARHQLPDAEIVDGILKVTPLANAVPEEAEALMRQAYALLPHVKVTDLLLEVDRWTRFTDDFTHLNSQEPAKDQPLLLSVILADAINLGLHKMAEACPGTFIAKLSWLSAWHIRDETYSKALAGLVTNTTNPLRHIGAKALLLPPTDNNSGPVAAGSKRAKSIFVTAPNLECSSTPTYPTSTRRFTPR